jgi:hypothetical protein
VLGLGLGELLVRLFAQVLHLLARVVHETHRRLLTSLSG